MGRARQTSTTRSRPNPIPNPNPNRTGLHQFSLFDGCQPAAGRCGLEQPTHGLWIRGERVAAVGVRALDQAPGQQRVRAHRRRRDQRLQVARRGRILPVARPHVRPTIRRDPGRIRGGDLRARLVGPSVKVVRAVDGELGRARAFVGHLRVAAPLLVRQLHRVLPNLVRR